MTVFVHNYREMKCILQFLFGVHLDHGSTSMGGEFDVSVQQW